MEHDIIEYGMISQKVESIICSELKKYEWTKCVFIEGENEEQKMEAREDGAILLTFLKIIPADLILVFCFVSLPMDISIDKHFKKVDENEQYNTSTYILSKEQIKQQCEEQGYMDLNYDSIWVKILISNLRREYLLNNTSKVISFILLLSSELHLKLSMSLTPCNSVSSSCLLTLYSNLMKQLVFSATLLSNQLKVQDNILRKKDEIIRFLNDTVISLGGSQLLNKWAPVGSNNYQCMQKWESREIKLPPDIDVQWMDDHIQNMMHLYLKFKGQECTIDDSCGFAKNANEIHGKRKMDSSPLEYNWYSRKSSSSESTSNEVNSLKVETDQIQKTKKAKKSFGKVRVSKGT